LMDRLDQKGYLEMLDDDIRNFRLEPLPETNDE